MNNSKLETEMLIHKSRSIRFIFIVLGIISVTLGVIGIFLPVMPTTVFLLLASYFFARGSDRFNYWLLNNKFLGKYIKNYKEGNGMTPRAKIISIALLWFGILLSVIFLLQNIYIKILLILIALGVTIHILYIKTMQPENS